MYYNEGKKNVVRDITNQLHKEELLLHLSSALKTESYTYAGILRDEIQTRNFTEKEKKVIRKSSFYLHLNGIFDE